MFSNSSEFDSSLDANAQQELSNDGSGDIASSASKKLDIQQEGISLFGEGRPYNVSWTHPTGPTMTENGNMRSLHEEDETFIDNRIYISNIPFSYTSVDLEKIFSSFGKVIAAQVVTNERGSKGFGFVTLDSAVGCDMAREQLDGTTMGGRKIEVKKARQMQHSRAVSNCGLSKNGNASEMRSLLSPSLLYPDASSLLPSLIGNNNLHGLGAMPGQSNAAAQFIAQLQLAQLQSYNQATNLLNLLASQPALGAGMGQSGLALQNPLLNSIMNPLGMAAPPINPFGLDTNVLLRQNANLNGLAHQITNQSDAFAALFPPPTDLSSLDALTAAGFLRPGGNLF